MLFGVGMRVCKFRRMFVPFHQKSPAAVRLGTSEGRFETGPFGRYQMKRAGVDNPVSVTLAAHCDLH
jgi:hypothetical protein